MNNNDEKYTELERNAKKSKQTNTVWIHDALMESIAELEITVKNGVIESSDKISIGVKDVVNKVCAHRIITNKPPLRSSDVERLVLWWRDSEVEQQNRQLRSDIAYDPTVPDRWEQLMRIVFKSDNRFDRIVLKHMVWILKRRFLGMDVGMIHRPMLLNIFGPPGSGKSGFYTEYLLTPFSQQSKKETTELVEMIKDERQHFNFGKHHMIVFTEKSGMERMDVEALKGLLDMEYINPRILGMNANDRLKNIATLFSSSNKRLRNCFPEMNPRKWYEITMPSRNDQEIRDYVVQRDSIPVMDLYRCIDENQESELLTNWDQVQDEIIYRCGYIDSIMTNLVEFSKRDHLGKEVLLNGFVEYFCSKDENRGSKFTNQGIRLKLEDMGFTFRKKSGGQSFLLDTQIVQRLEERINQSRNVFDFGSPVTTDQEVDRL